MSIKNTYIFKRINIVEERLDRKEEHLSFIENRKDRVPFHLSTPTTKTYTSTKFAKST